MNLNVNNFSLCLAAILVVIAIMISSQQKLGLTKDIIISIARAIIQLVIVSYILLYVFKVNNLWLTLTLMLLIIFNDSGMLFSVVKPVNTVFCIHYRYFYQYHDYDYDVNFIRCD